MRRAAIVRRLGVAATLLLLAGCSGQRAAETAARNGAAATVSGFVPPATRAPAPLPGQAHTSPLTAFVGKYPNETVDGVGFFDRTEVANALDEAVRDPKLRETFLHGAGPQTPIFRQGDAVGVWGCTAHDCGDRNWTLLVSTRGAEAQACFHDASATGERSRWYTHGTAVTRPGGCPSGDS